MNNTLLTEDELLLKSTVRDFAQRSLAPRAANYDQSGFFPADNIKEMASLGLFGLGIDPSYGGGGGAMRQTAAVVEELARGCVGTSTIYVAHHSLATQYIYRYGSDTHKQKYIPPMATAEKIGAFALTEPDAGSDAAGITTMAVRNGDDYVINGTKIFITNAVEADVFVVLVTLNPSLRSKGVIALIVDADTPGIAVNKMPGKMGIRASSTAEVVFKDCHVPVTNLIGSEQNGFRSAMEVLNTSRIGIAAQAVGIAQAAYDEALGYVKKRTAFANHLADFQGVQWSIADMATRVHAARLMALHAATLHDKDQPFIKEASMAKLFASRAAVENADKAVQLHGGLGYFAPTTAERLYRDAKITEIYEGASEIQRLIIARSVIDESP